MAVQTATIDDVVLVKESTAGYGDYAVAEIAVSGSADYTGASDTFKITGVKTAIQNARRDGKTVTLRYAMPSEAGVDESGTAVYVETTTISTADLTGDLSNSAGTELANAYAPWSGGKVLVAYSLA